MNTDSTCSTTGYGTSVAPATAGGPSSALMRRTIHQTLARLHHGRITVIEGAERATYGSPAADDLQATIHVLSPELYQAVAFGGILGSADAYIAGHWTCDDLTALIRILLRNEDALDRLGALWRRLVMPIFATLSDGFRPWLNANGRAASKRHISAHYDLGNDFYRLWLDETMSYSCGIFTNESTTLHGAQVAKLDRICRRLELSPRDHLLEIGTGWGGLALHAAQYYGCRVTTTTISREQYRFASQRIADAGLAHQVTVLECDYRDLRGQYDKLVSVEMLEAIGWRAYPRFFDICARMLKPHGRMLLQTITIADRYYEAAKRQTDFIKKYIFPGSCIPSVAAVQSAAARTDLTLRELVDIGPHYATTLARWRERFHANVAAIRSLGMSESFIRKWHFYLCYCEAGFEEQTLGDIQALFSKPDDRPRLAP